MGHQSRDLCGRGSATRLPRLPAHARRAHLCRSSRARRTNCTQHPMAAPRCARKIFTSFSMKRRTPNRRNFPCCSKLRVRPKRPVSWMETKTDPPRPGHFCMVGDFQQSIYHDRADLQHYEAMHHALVGQNAPNSSKFSVTFRLDHEQLKFINQTFREILNNEDGQVEFVEMQPRPEVLPGQVIRVSLGKDLLPEDELKEYRKARVAAKELAAWIAKTGLKKLCARIPGAMLRFFVHARPGCARWQSSCADSACRLRFNPRAI